MSIDSKKILKKAQKMKEENDSAKVKRKAKKELWKTQTLKDSLYNDEGDGKKIPRVSDIKQVSYDHFNYVLKGYGLNDCFLLADLMGIAKNNPDFIQNTLIKIEKDDEVEVGLYETKPPIIKATENMVKITYESTGSKKFYSVSKSEALNWKTSHSALWPVVIEIAYAKHLKNIAAGDPKKVEESLKNAIRPVMEPQVEEAFKARGVDPTPEQIETEIELVASAAVQELLKDNINLRDLFKGGGFSALALTHLTGAKSKQRLYGIDSVIDENIKKIFKGVDTSTIKPFPNEYSGAVLKIYDKIKKKLESNKIVIVGFKGSSTLPTSILNSSDLPKTDNEDVALAVIGLINSLKKDSKTTIRGLISQDILKTTYKDWLATNKLDFEKLKSTTDENRKKFILENVDFGKKFKISKTKTGIIAAHAYLVVGTLEHEGHKYIILRNPNSVKTKIDYKKSSKVPKEVKLPEEIDRSKNECMMELNHFYKKLNSIDYNK